MASALLNAPISLFSHRPVAPVLAMHIPDGFLSWPVSLLGWGLALSLLVVCQRRVQRDYQERLVPMMGVCGAFIFAAQMINFAIPGGTSGHLLGGTLAGVLLGPWAGSLVMMVVFIVQAIVFQDGGLTVLGANIVNMGLVGTFCGYFLYRAIRLGLGRDSWRGIAIGAAIASWCSVLAGSLLCAIELSISGTVPFLVVVPAMALWHVMIGIGEAIITVTALGFVYRTRPDLIYYPPRKTRIPVELSS